MIKNLSAKNISPTRKRIIALSLLITLLAQIVLVYIGIDYAVSTSQFIDRKQRTNMIDHLQQNVFTQLYDIDSLLQLLQTPDFSDFFQENMNLRDEETVLSKKAELNNKLNELHLSSDEVKQIYFIGTDNNQASLVKEIGTDSIGELTQIRMDKLQDIQMGDLFLKDYNRLASYSIDELKPYIDKTRIDLGSEGMTELNGLLQSLTGNLVISNGNINGVLVIIVLNPDLFHASLGERYKGIIQYSILTDNGKPVWSTVSDEAMRRSMLTDSPASFSFQNVEYMNTTKELNPFPYRVTITHSTDFSRFSKNKVYAAIILLSLVTLLVSFIVGLACTKKIFRPFHSLAVTMKLRARSKKLSFATIEAEGDLSGKGLNSLSLRSKLIVILSLAVIVPTITDGLLSYQILNKTFQSQADQALSEMAEVSKVALDRKVAFFTHLGNQISVSQQLQQYLTIREEQISTLLRASPSISISMFPGLNEVSYFVIYDSNGNCIYSSIFSNNPELFHMDKDLLKEQTEPYWISGYDDVFNNRSFGLMKQIKHYGSINDSKVNYLFMVPKESFFEEIGPIDSAFQLYDEKDKLVYQYHSFPEGQKHNLMSWSERIPGLSWVLHIEYSKDELTKINREYNYRFMIVILIVLFLCISFTWLISSYLVKPINLLKRTMALVGKGDLKQQALYESGNEIGEIIGHYNDMILKLNETVQENMRIMEENIDNQLREKNLIFMKTRAELRMLQAQINPHFLYNTLEVINMKSMSNGNPEISLMVTALADLFRYSTSLKADTVPLEAELNHIQNYIAIHQIRLEHSFEFKLEVPEKLLSVPVVKFILQPIVENCLNHGIFGYDEGGIILISADEQNGMLRLTIRDNGFGMLPEKLNAVNQSIQTGMDEECSEINPKGIGLSNVYHRLRLFYKEDASMTVSSRPMKGTMVTVLFPISNTR